LGAFAGSFFAVFFRDRLHARIFSAVVVKVDGFFFQQINHAGKSGLLANRNLHRERIRAKPALNAINGARIRRAHAVHLVGETNPGNLVAVRLTPDGLALGFHALHGIKNNHAAVEHAQRALNFGGEIDVPGGVDQINAVALPLRGDRGGHNRDAAFAFLSHPVGDSGAVIHVAQAVGLAGIVKNPLGSRCFTSVNMGNNANITILLERKIFHQ